MLAQAWHAMMGTRPVGADRRTALAKTGAPTRSPRVARAPVRWVASAGGDGANEPAPTVRSHKVRWNEKYTELAAFEREHGHVSVPPRDPFVDLNKWVVYQRKRRRLGTMSPEQEVKLDKLGVCWEPRTPRPDRRGMELRWNERFDELTAFVRSNNHTRVPSGDTKLHRWLHEQRRSFAKGKLAETRRVRLESIGVDLRSASRMTWGERVDELRLFREAHGHCNVPATWRHNPSLGSWVKHQRMQCRGGKLSDERYATLDALGFNWDPKKKESKTGGGGRSVVSRPRERVALGARTRRAGGAGE